jgi:hypothetical protein
MAQLHMTSLSMSMSRAYGTLLQEVGRACVALMAEMQCIPGIICGALRAELQGKSGINCIALRAELQG